MAKKKNVIKEAEVGTVTYELNTDILPVLDANQYYTALDFPEEAEATDENQRVWDNYILGIAEKYIERMVQMTDSSIRVSNLKYFHPRQYNNGGDEIDFTIYLNRTLVNRLIARHKDNQDFLSYIDRNYQSHSGYISFMATTQQEFIDQSKSDPAKSIAQIIMYNCRDAVEETQREFESEVFENRDELDIGWNFDDDFDDDMEENYRVIGYTLDEEFNLSQIRPKSFEGLEKAKAYGTKLAEGIKYKGKISYVECYDLKNNDKVVWQSDVRENKEPVKESKGGYVKTYKGYRIMDTGDNFTITDSNGKTVGTERTIVGCEGTIDGLTNKKKVSEGKMKESKQLNEGLIDCVLDRIDGIPYDPREFYHYCNGWYNNIASALDNGTEDDVREAIVRGIKASIRSDGGDPENPYAQQLYDWVRKANWIEDTDNDPPMPQYLVDIHNETRGGDDDLDESLIKEEDERYRTIRELINDLSNMFIAAKMDCPEIYTVDDDTIAIEISGDWKHDHLACDALIKRYFPNAYITQGESDNSDSDFYTATHFVDIDSLLDNSNKTIVRGECEWCGHWYDMKDLTDTDFGRICYKCKNDLENGNGKLDESAVSDFQYTDKKSCKNEGCKKKKGKKPVKESKPLNEGPGAGYTVKASVSAHNINSLEITNIDYDEDEIFSYNGTFTIDADCDIDATVENIYAESYYYDAEINESVPGKITKFRAEISFRDLRDYGDGIEGYLTQTEEGDEIITKENILAYLNGYQKDLHDLIIGTLFYEAKSTVSIGGGYIRTDWDGTLARMSDEYSFDGESYYWSEPITADIKVIDEEAISYVNKAVYGDNITTSYTVYDENDDILEDFADKDEAIEYSKKHPYSSVHEITWREYYNGDTDSIDHEVIYTNGSRPEGVDDDVDESKKPRKSKRKINEGTWLIPFNKEDAEYLQDWMKKPHTAKEFMDDKKLSWGDDALYDDLDDLEYEEPESDCRDVVAQNIRNLVKNYRENPESYNVKASDEVLDILDKTANYYLDESKLIGIEVETPSPYKISKREKHEMMQDLIDEITINCQCDNAEIYTDNGHTMIKMPVKDSDCENYWDEYCIRQETIDGETYNIVDVDKCFKKLRYDPEETFTENKKVEVNEDRGYRDEDLYKVSFNTGTYELHTETVYAFNEQEAADKAADNIVEKGLTRLYKDLYEIKDECEDGETEDDYIAANNLVSLGNNGYYFSLERIEQVDRESYEPKEVAEISTADKQQLRVAHSLYGDFGLVEAVKEFNKKFKDAYITEILKQPEGLVEEAFDKHLAEQVKELAKYLGL